ncbi:DNA glycosylase AlkZ-like family protein [Nonomuraea sp. H19]|uniref:DNA glycosylase AlkZ-like family protein n=1 Tax=Nonomuraea sp. H19 TaxID=3452206 RepID=UPI003F894078
MGGPRPGAARCATAPAGATPPPTPARRGGCPASLRCTPPAALAELVRRYLYAYGPATPTHLAQWLSAPFEAVSRLMNDRL